jgi:hypothetical protein
MIFSYKLAKAKLRSSSIFWKREKMNKKANEVENNAKIDKNQKFEGAPKLQPKLLRRWKSFATRKNLHNAHQALLFVPIWLSGFCVSFACMNFICFNQIWPGFTLYLLGEFIYKFY